MTLDTDDWGPWFEEHGAALLLFARQHVRSLADAEDVLQEAFVRFWRSRHRARDRLAYLYTCVKRMAMDYRRGEQRRQQRESAVARPVDAAWFDADAGDRREIIERAMDGLPIQQRETLVMKMWGGATFRQIGEALGISPKAAAYRYRSALAELRSTIAEDLV